MNVLSLDVVNSELWDGFGERTDLLLDPGWLEEFLARWNLSSTPIDAVPIQRLTELRGVLRTVVETLAAGQQPDAATLATLNQLLEAAPAYRTLARSGDEYSINLIPAASSADWLLAEIAASTVELLAPDTRHRIKVCANPKCRWAFYDRSRGNTRRWCDDRTCGNRDKVRRFRQRHTRIAASEPSG